MFCNRNKRLEENRNGACKQSKLLAEWSHLKLTKTLGNAGKACMHFDNTVSPILLTLSCPCWLFRCHAKPFQLIALSSSGASARACSA
eukprot:4616215-Amphidinium_carterae.1